MSSNKLNIVVVGGGFTGVAVALTLHKKMNQPTSVTLLEKSGRFAEGEAYSTRFPHHLLNVRAKDMSVYEDQPHHFVDWIIANESIKPYIEASTSIKEQFVPRMVYHLYLKSQLDGLHSSKTFEFKTETAEVVDISSSYIELKDKRHLFYDKAILALGNESPSPLPLSSTLNIINDPWDYDALKNISATADVMIVGTGLSMIDAVLTLHQQNHKGKIYAVSRHGLLPLSHNATQEVFRFDNPCLPTNINKLMKIVRDLSLQHISKGGDWRSVIDKLRYLVPTLWSHATIKHKKRFLRHVMPYWSIHRHRVHEKINALLKKLIEKEDLMIIAGRVLGYDQNYVSVRERDNQIIKKLKVDTLINCMGFNKLKYTQNIFIQQLLNKKIAQLDPLNMGFRTNDMGALIAPNGEVSDSIYTIGPPCRGMFLECNAVPDIRSQCNRLTDHLMCLETCT